MSRGREWNLEIEVYDCGCKTRLYQLDLGEAKGDLPQRPARVSEFIPCSRHKGHRNAPRDARLIMVRGEHEAFLNE